ncbi:class II aldolase/adducin family protein [Sphingobium nicotianae]|uniref:Class II aldolase/adducin family protein n=1 Tax=Sphingobium nicotianae TaxID=2782607 RepID=A0A9X1DEV3_9SPHN|nr:class II aldolase/adducin family protein [Sphingobium nicotianae]MBT2188645.1 class II aldolase/adducin family protein [Sphingobium nicotianae]
MKNIDHVKRELVIANRILAHEGVMDAYGHVSMRNPLNPDRFLLSRSCSPGLVDAEDILEFDLDGRPSGIDDGPLYIERFIHAAIYAAREDVSVIAHSHATDVLPYTVTNTPLRPLIHSAGVIGHELPCWDIHDRFGETNMLVVDMDQGRDLAERLGPNKVVLMRGHGFSAVARSLVEVIRICIYLRVNAAVLGKALALGDVTYLTTGEIDRIGAIDPSAPEVQRAWRYWAARAGCDGMLAE